MELFLKIFAIIILAIISAVLYRCGGSGNWPRYFRPTGLMLTQTVSLIILGYIHWTLILCAGAIYGLSTTYFKKKGTDAKWWNWALVGIGFSIAILPLVLVYGNWIGFAIRSAVCTFLVIAWSEANGNVVWEEGGRGVIPIITLPLLLI